MSIVVDHLTKIYRVVKQKSIFKPRFEQKVALNNISFQIDQGESVAYIGPNGSGKSTTIKLLTGLLTPTSGKVTVNGLEPYKKRKENARNIGFVFGQRTQLWWDLPITESFDLLKEIYRIPNAVYKRNLEMLFTLLDLQGFKEIPVRQLSLGQRMRAEVACAFLHSPRIVYLDEPTIGIDIVTKAKIRDFLRDINKEEKTTIILTSHDIDDIETVCKRLILIDKGHIVYDGQIVDFIERYAVYKKIRVAFKERDIQPILIPRCEVSRETTKSNELIIRYKKDEIDTNELLNILQNVGTISDFTAHDDNLTDLLKSIYKEEI
jgi:ABC-type uncharacterized transport system, ATPase component